MGFCEFQALNISVLFEYSSLAFYFQVTYDQDGVKTTVTKTIITDGGRGGQLISKKRKKKHTQVSARLDQTKLIHDAMCLN